MEGDTLPLLGKSFSEHDPSGAQSKRGVRVRGAYTELAPSLQRECKGLAVAVAGAGSQIVG